MLQFKKKCHHKKAEKNLANFEEFTYLDLVTAILKKATFYVG